VTKSSSLSSRPRWKLIPHTERKTQAARQSLRGHPRQHAGRLSGIGLGGVNNDKIFSGFALKCLKSMVSVDFFTVPTIGFQVLSVFLVLAHDPRD
jgi:hypothetical protein